MKRVEQRVSPQAFARIQDEMLRARNQGHSEDYCTRQALARVGLWPKDWTETVLVVDYSLRSVVWPFEEPCSEDMVSR